MEEIEEMASDVDPIKSHMAFHQTETPNIGSPEPLKTLQEILDEKTDKKL